eukprot:MONOS_4045.1-p1 / transcript=MONOS_4045.1 / gene=MONOS_4045 / organism=Monocercomonoides_exilis_PA203 / gene_product=pre-mRNA-processing factor 19, putative / transcript_product=pre-mRNA-processing factor 19, putative / location=Mono_scaffold00102:108868-109095(+) / protein_length=76 / sequence_SO=supercontig / SO=protein_coding / is_pseudo=false
MSVPDLLKQLTSEWDAAMLQVSHLKKQLEETQRQLATSLYLNDGAKRTVARLIKERDEARAELEQLKSSNTVSSS